MTAAADDFDFWAHDPVVIDRGGILSPDRLTELEQLNWDIVSGLAEQAFDTLRRTELAAELVGLQMHLIDSPAINAFLRVVGQRKIIGLNRGLIDQLWTLLATLMAHPEVLQEHFKDKPTVDLEVWRRDLQAQLASLREKRVQPADIPDYITKDRLEHATLFYCCMIDYVIHHELAHLVRGHAPLLSARYALSAVEEVPRETLSEEIRHTLNLIEIDADLHGLDLLVEYEPEFHELRAATATTAKRRDHMFLHTFPLLLISQLFDFQHMSIATQLSQQHPPPVYRAIINTMALSDTYELTVGLSKEDAIDEHDKAGGKPAAARRCSAFPKVAGSAT